MLPSRDEAYGLVLEYTSNLGLIRHMRSVEIAMRAYAQALGAEVERWGLVGLLHDFDYERWPDPPDHPLRGAEILQARGYPDDVIYAIKSHADYLPDCPRTRPIEKALYACDEWCGLISAAALVKPQGLAELTPESVLKKFKSKGFAAKINREDLTRGVADFGVEPQQHVEFLITALRPHADELGLSRVVT